MNADIPANPDWIDATTFTHGDKLYYVWAQKHPDILGNSSLYIAQMKSPTELPSEPVFQTLSWNKDGFPVFGTPQTQLSIE